MKKTRFYDVRLKAQGVILSLPFSALRHKGKFDVASEGSTSKRNPQVLRCIGGVQREKAKEEYGNTPGDGYSYVTTQSSGTAGQGDLRLIRRSERMAVVGTLGRAKGTKMNKFEEHTFQVKWIAAMESQAAQGSPGGTRREVKRLRRGSEGLWSGRASTYWGSKWQETDMNRGNGGETRMYLWGVEGGGGAKVKAGNNRIGDGKQLCRDSYTTLHAAVLVGGVEGVLRAGKRAEVQEEARIAAVAAALEVEWCLSTRRIIANTTHLGGADTALNGCGWARGRQAATWMVVRKEGHPCDVGVTTCDATCDADRAKYSRR
ncbi:hypothetical protein R3P38DRAFT_2780167 [Favolaschia claudopus]|uniref:Uncharacterized protein n=1 Tax=Favolaschia claudopus TaxID=2862362 RepID=A0AAW0BC28_9AGAR